MKSIVKFAAFTFLAAATAASADTEIRFTGSTAFRSAVHAGLLNSFFTAAPKYAHSNATGLVGTASKSIWQGSVSGISGITTVRCTWSGSATGIQSVTAGSNVSFLTVATLPGSPGENPSQSTSENLVANAAFSDVGQGSTIFSSPTLEDTPVGVVAFTWAVNDSASAHGFDNITAQFARALYATGSQPKSMLTGNAADTKLVYAVGRDTGSGTRITMLAETKYGVFTPLTQFMVTAASDAVTELQVWPVAPASGGDALGGNGGYTGSSGVSGALSNKTDTSFTLKGAAGNVLGTIPSAHLVSWVGISDSNTIVTNGGARLKYEGVSYVGSADDAKIQNGLYTAWGYQHLLSATLDTDQTAARDALVTAIDTNIGTAGVASSTMNVGRGEDGGVVGP